MGLSPPKRTSPVIFPWVLRPARTSIRVVFPDPEGPLRSEIWAPLHKIKPFDGRFLRATKRRFGPAGPVGFEACPNPLTAHMRQASSPGSM